ncbi:MAG TPA: hemerythrin domain-containing protein [Thermodesulfobacteriota bacterium]
MTFEIPEPLKVEHEALHADLVEAIRAGGRVGAAAQAVADVLHPHFVREEEIAMPPLALLEPLAAGRVTPEMASALEMTDALKAELPRMLAEHGRIVKALEALADAGRAEARPEIVAFAEKLMLHAQVEEKVLYPASILVGEYLKARLGR